jgi:DNA polymerase IV
MARRILHIDMDAFFASCEMVRDPSLKGKALIIGGEKDAVRGVVSTASYEARKYGVHSAMPIAQARRLCPHAIYLRGNYHLYSQASRTVRAVLESVSPLVEMASIDEGYVDVTGSQKIFGGDDGIAAYIKSEIRKQTQLPCTLAISSNRRVSKIASDEGKPDGYLIIPEGGERAFLAPLAVKKLPGAGPRTCELLNGLGIVTLGQLAEADLKKLDRVFGMQQALQLQQAARGHGADAVVRDSAPKSISRETTFETDADDWERLEAVLTCLTEYCCRALREHGMETKCVTLKVRYPPFETHTFSKTLADPACLDVTILKTVRELLPKCRAAGKPVRLIGVGLSRLSWNQHQMGLFSAPETAKWEQVMESVDHLRGRMGFDAINLAASLKAGKNRYRDREDLNRTPE